MKNLFVWFVWFVVKISTNIKSLTGFWNGLIFEFYQY